MGKGVRTIGRDGRRGFAVAAVVVCAGLAGAALPGCGGSGGPGGGTGPVPDPERDGCAPYAWYTDGDVPVATAAAWIGALIEDIAVEDGLAVLASRSCGLRVVNVSDPTAPRLLGAAAGPQAVDVALDGRLAAVAEGDRGVALYDLTDPARPELLARIAITGPGETSRYTDAVALAGAASSPPASTANSSATMSATRGRRWRRGAWCWIGRASWPCWATGCSPAAAPSSASARPAAWPWTTSWRRDRPRTCWWPATGSTPPSPAGWPSSTPRPRTRS
ncbi:MAG: hypothetical protein ABR506_08820 [Candidatus Krumholzibacteriia bacterium]